jgi:hypothetical protein
MDHLPDIVPHARYLPSGHVAVVSFVAIAIFVIYKVSMPLNARRYELTLTAVHPH